MLEAIPTAYGTVQCNSIEYEKDYAVDVEEVVSQQYSCSRCEVHSNTVHFHDQSTICG